MSSQQKDHVNIQLDKQERSDLLLSVFKDDFRTIAFLAPVLLAAEIVLFILPDKLFSYSKVILPFIFCSMVLLPLVFLVRRMLHKLHPLIINSVQAVYALSVLLLGVFLSLESMGIVDFVHMFLMAMVAVATFLSFVAITRTVLFLSSYVIFALYLPQYQPDPDLRFVVLANVFIFGSLCWLLG